MSTFVISCENRPGELARVCEAIAGREVNITSVAGLGAGAQGAVGVTTDDDPATRAALSETGMSFREAESVSVTLPHRPGALGQASRRLADAGVNVEYVAVAGLTGESGTIVFGVSDATKAQEALGDLVR